VHLAMSVVRYCDQTVRRRGSAMISLHTAMTSFYKLLIATMPLSAAVWPQF